MSPDGPPLRVLVADDQRINRVLLERSLDPARYVVIHAENGRQAVELFDQARPDVVFLDVMMPEMDGFEAARAMKARLADDHVPIIMVTSLSDEESLRQGMAAGADDFIPKPFNRVVLESKMMGALRTRSVFRTLRARTLELEALHEQIRAEQVMAEKLMAGVLRMPALESPKLKHRSRPMDLFNGDLLMAHEGADGRLRLMLGDFAGHGLAAAIGGLPVVTSFERLCKTEATLFEVGQAANAALRAILPRDRFMAAVLLELDPRRREVQILNAGMPSVVVRAAGGGIRARLPSTHLPLAILPELDRPEQLTRLVLAPGERLYLCSDGVIEATAPGGEPFGAHRLEEALAQAPRDGQAFDCALAALGAFVGDAPAADDVTFVEVWPDAPGAALEVELASADVPPARLDLVLTPELLRNADALQMVQNLLEGFWPLEGHRAHVFAIVAELLNNAVDHGLLALDSTMKADIEGFTAYYEERRRRLEVLEEGFVKIAMTLEKAPPGWRLSLELEDSGPGFSAAVGSSSSPQAPHGRGITMVRGLCESLRYHPPGNRVEATYAWSTDLAPP